MKIGKEYDKNGSLLFEGQYLDDKKWNGTIFNNNGFLYPIKNGNGKVKRYNQDNKLIFEGEYINGEKKGKEYHDECGKLIFEGEYLNGKKWNGKIREYTIRKNHDCCCKGIPYCELEYREKTKGKKILRYKGEYLNGKKNGKGKEYDINGKLIYEGEYLNGKMKKGKNNKNHLHEYVSYSLEGNLKNGLLNGIVKEYEERQLIFEGEYLNVKKNRKGKEYEMQDRRRQFLFEGEYLDGKRWNGKGKEFDYKKI